MADVLKCSFTVISSLCHLFLSLYDISLNTKVLVFVCFSTLKSGFCVSFGVTASSPLSGLSAHVSKGLVPPWILSPYQFKPAATHFILSNIQMTVAILSIWIFIHKELNQGGIVDCI